jgi:hypothetical protein
MNYYQSWVSNRYVERRFSTNQNVFQGSIDVVEFSKKEKQNYFSPKNTTPPLHFGFTEMDKGKNSLSSLLNVVLFYRKHNGIMRLPVLDFTEMDNALLKWITFY